MDLERLYRYRFSREERQRLDGVWKVLVDDFFSRWIRPDDAVLDVGAGTCLFINNVRARRRVALDVNSMVEANCAPGVEFATSLDALGEDRFDVAFMSNLLEHLSGAAEVVELLSGVRRRLQPRGRLIVLQPNFALVGARYFDFIDHRTVLTDRSLAEALALAGYRIVFLRKRFLPYTSKSRLPKAPWLVRWYLKFPPAQYLLGKQTLAVAEPDDAG